MDLDYGRYMLTEGRNREEPYRTFSTEDIVNEFRFNLLDWGSSNILTIALGNTVYIWDANQAIIEEDATVDLFTADEVVGLVTSVGWAPDGHQLAFGLLNSQVHLLNSSTATLETTLTSSEGVCSLTWNNSILTTGAINGRIYNYDVRVGSKLLQPLGDTNQRFVDSNGLTRGSSGGKDNLVHIWDVCMTNSSTRCLYRLNEHRAPMKALAWYPFQRNLLASGGGEGDQCIKFWNTNSGKCCNSVDTGSQVCALLWNKNEPPKLLSSHGEPKYQLTRWKCPSMLKKTEFIDHASSVLFMTQSPDEVTVASAAGDEVMFLWKAFEKPAPKTKDVLFADSNRANIR